MSPGRLDADVDQYRQAAAANSAPPQVMSDPLASGLTPIDQLVQLLGLAANLSDEQDNAEGADEHRERDLKTTDAADGFAAQDDEAAARLHGPDPAQQIAQQIPQLAAGIAGALGSAMQPITQIPQQITQGAQQAMQAGLGLLQQAGATPGLDAGDLADPGLDEDFSVGDLGGGADGFGSGGAGGGAGVGTGPPAVLGPPAPPSAGTFASAVRSAPATPAAAPAPNPVHGGGMAGMPMVPPAAMNGAAAADKDTATGTKRVSVPPVRNGAPVQGRITAPAADANPTRTAPAKPVATRRIIVARAPDTVDPAERP